MHVNRIIVLATGCFVLAGCNEQAADVSSKDPQALVEVLFCIGNLKHSMHPASAEVVAVAPGVGFPPDGTIEVAFKSKGKVLGTGTSEIHRQFGTRAEYQTLEALSVFKTEVRSDGKLTDVDECIVTGYWDEQGKPVRFEEQAGIVGGAGLELLRGAGFKSHSEGRGQVPAQISE